MENYIFVNNHKIELNDDQIRRIMEAVGQQVKLSEVAVGDSFKIGSHELVVLSQDGEYTSVIRKDLLPKDLRFGQSNKYSESDVDEACTAFARELADVVGWESIPFHTVDLTADDGLKDYGAVDRRVSLLTADRYRRYVEVLDNHKPKRWWWLATPYSTATHDNDSWVKCVSPSGGIDYDFCNNGHGVRPFCILKSSIFVSK